MAARAKTAGVLGAVVDGRIRDLEEHWGLGAKVWARGTGITGAGGGGWKCVRWVICCFACLEIELEEGCKC